MGELLKLAISQVQRRRGLSKCTSFERIKLTGTSTDPMTGKSFIESMGSSPGEECKQTCMGGCILGLCSFNRCNAFVS